MAQHSRFPCTLQTNCDCSVIAHACFLSALTFVVEAFVLTLVSHVDRCIPFSIVFLNIAGCVALQPPLGSAATSIMGATPRATVLFATKTSDSHRFVAALTTFWFNGLCYAFWTVVANLLDCVLCVIFAWTAVAWPLTFYCAAVLQVLSQLWFGDISAILVE